MTKLNYLTRDRVIGPEGGAEDGASGAGVGEGVAGVDVLVVSSSLCRFNQKAKVGSTWIDGPTLSHRNRHHGVILYIP
jgi:hypothetical protein